jgi:hypothetical protein
MGNSIRDCFSGLTEPRESNMRHQFEPACMYRTVNGDNAGILLQEAFRTRLAPRWEDPLSMIQKTCLAW